MSQQISSSLSGSHARSGSLNHNVYISSTDYRSIKKRDGYEGDSNSISVGRAKGGIERETTEYSLTKAIPISGVPRDIASLTKKTPYTRLS